MKRIYPSRYPAALLTAGLLLLTGCELSCSPSMTAPPQFMLAFSTDTLASTGVGFRRAEIRSAYLVRYGSADFQPVLDTLRQPTLPVTNSTQPVFSIFYGAGYAPQFGFPEYVRQNVNARSFRLVVPAANRTYDITNIVLTQEAGSGHCSNPHPTHNEATVNGQLRDALNQTPQLTK